MVLGYDFHMGRNRACDVGRLSELGASLGYGLDVVPPAEYGGTPISSSRIRERLSAGDPEAARDMLGRPYSLSGPVVAGEGAGRELGAPTANLELPAEKLLPADGVYLATCPTLGGVPALLYVGARPTFGPGDRRAEVHLLNTEADLMGRRLEVAVVRRLRDDREFADRDELRAQIGRDLDVARSAAEAGEGPDGSA
jgi:riboflavin kinase/FMN adenylyltransferase